MAKFIVFSKLVDLGRLTINMDTVRTMEPVSRLYDGSMKECTDIYYENHRVTVLSSLDEITEIITSMEDGDIVDITEDIDSGTGYDPDDPGGNNIIYIIRSIQQFTRNTPGTDLQHQILLTDSGMVDPWPGSSSSSQYNINIPENQDYVFVVYMKQYTGNHQYSGWGVPNIYADEQSANNFLESKTNTSELEWYGPVQVPLNTIFDIEEDEIEQNTVISKMYIAAKKTIMGNRQSNILYFGVSDTPDGAADIAGISPQSNSIRELPLPGGEEIEILNGTYQAYLV